MWLFAAAAVAAVALFRPRPEAAREWMHGHVVEVGDDQTFGFQPDGKDFWFTVRVESRIGTNMEAGQVVEVQPIEFEKDGALRASVRR